MDILEPPPSPSSTPTFTTNPPRQPPPKPKSCALCSQHSKYTCPRCHTSTCSLACSQTHKSRTKCTGVRDKAAYIPLNKYGWGTMMDDYCFLEDVGRKVGEVGREIVRGGFDMNVHGMAMSGRGGVNRGRGRGRGRGGVMRGRDRGGWGRGGKRELLKMQLEARDIEVELLANGMERRNLNQSVWDPKTQAALLTIQFKFHPSTEARSASGTAQPFTLLTHRNSLSTPLLTLIQQRIKDRLNKKPTKTKTSECSTSPATDSFPSWISPLVFSPPEDPENFTTPTFVIAAPPDPLLVARSAALLSTGNQNHPNTKLKPYYSLGPNETLLQSLRGTQFVEFPLIEVWEEFNGVLVDKRTGGVRCVGKQEEPQRKRRKLNPEEGKRAISGLVGEYGSDDDDGDDDEQDERENGLVEYVESDEDEGGGVVAMGQDNTVDEEIEVEENDEDVGVGVDPAVLLELMQRAKQEGKWVEEDDDDDSDDPGGAAT